MSPAQARVVARHFEPLLSAFVVHCNDGNEKVAAAAIDALGVYVEGFASCFVESALARLLPKLFLKADGKPTRAGVERAVRGGRNVISSPHFRIYR